MIKLRKKDMKALSEAVKTAKDGDLYKALHFVGDDPIKSLIEDTLKQTLTADQFKTVVAIFTLATSDDSPWFED